MSTSTGATLLIPSWEPWRDWLAEPQPNASARLLVVGGTRAQQEFLRRCYPRARLLEWDAVRSTDELTRDLTVEESIEHVMWLAPGNGDAEERIDHDDVIDAQDLGVIGLFRLVKALLQLGYSRRPLGWTIITWQTQAHRPTEIIDPTHASVHGFFGSLAKEQSKWKMRLIDLPSRQSIPFVDIFRLPSQTDGNSYLYREGDWHVQRLMLCAPQLTSAAAYRHRGTYVVVGGSGGIGEVFSNFLAEKYQAQMIWLGRRELNDDIQRKIDRCAAIGPSPMYIRADATDRVALKRAHDEIMKQHTHVHGVVHSAIVLLDGIVANMSEDQMKQALAAKVDVSVRLAQVFGQEPLDFALFFSSILSFLRPPGQSNYVAGSTFEDAYARALTRFWSCPTKVMNWGYWGNAGIVSTRQYRARMRHLGLDSIEIHDAAAGLDTLLRSSVDQLVLARECDQGTLHGTVPDAVLVELPEVADAIDLSLLLRSSHALAAEGPAIDQRYAVSTLRQNRF